jgi:AhpD family alkylhydroperoxidase
MNDPQCHDKPVWTLPALAATLPSMPGHLARMLPTVLDVPISGKLRERIMLAVAAENRCRYCRVAHTALGRAVGLSPDEIDEILENRDASLPPGEALAVAYARDLARRGFLSHDQDLRARLAGLLGASRAEAVESTAHVMNFANRFGNTFDAAWTRLSGGCERSGATLLDMAAVSSAFMLAAAVAGPAIGALMLYQKVQGTMSHQSGKSAGRPEAR